MTEKPIDMVLMMMMMMMIDPRFYWEEVHHWPQGHETFTIPTTIQSPIGDTSVATSCSHAKLTWPHMCEQPSKMNVC
jgi:hypothetical protein